MQPSPAPVRFSFLRRNTLNFPTIKSGFCKFSVPGHSGKGQEGSGAAGTFSHGGFVEPPALSISVLSSCPPWAGDKAPGDGDTCPGQCPAAGTASPRGQGRKKSFLPPRSPPGSARVGPLGLSLCPHPLGAVPWKREAGSFPKSSAIFFSASPSPPPCPSFISFIYPDNGLSLLFYLFLFF